MRFTEFKNIEPRVGDILGLEFGDTLIEVVINEVRDDGVVIQLDEQTVNIIKEIQALPQTEPDGTPIIPGPRSGQVYRLPSYYKAEPKAEPDTKPEAEPDTKPEAEPVPSGNYENAINWVVEMLNSLPDSIIDKLSRQDNGTIVEYLKIRANKTNAYVNHDFDSADLKTAQSQLSDYFGNLDIQTWKDLLVKDLTEAEYQGRKVQLGKPMAGDVKKSKVYVKGPKGNVVKVNFGDPNMKIKKSNPKRRKSFRARHNCDNPGPRWKARYWSCRAW
jgi:hypothetical protein